MTPAPALYGELRPLEDLEADDCHWPVLEDRRGVWLFCGERRRLGCSYCPEHAATAFRGEWRSEARELWSVQRWSFATLAPPELVAGTEPAPSLYDWSER